MPTDIQTLQSLDLFKELTDEELAVVSELFQPTRVLEGEVLTRRKDAAHSFYVILSGNYMIYFKEGRAFTLHERGEIIGMSVVLTPFSYKGTTVALTDGEVLAAAGDEFLKMVQGNAALGEKLMRRLNDVISHRSQFTTVSGVPETEVSVEEA